MRKDGSQDYPISQIVDISSLTNKEKSYNIFKQTQIADLAKKTTPIWEHFP